jgi:hypothetical protein
LRPILLDPALPGRTHKASARRSTSYSSIEGGQIVHVHVTEVMLQRAERGLSVRRGLGR